MNKHLMIDIETLGTSNCAPILSIGAVVVGEDSTFYEKCHPSLEPPFEPDFSTLQWWVKQNDKAREAFDGGIPWQRAMSNFSWFYSQMVNQYGDLKVWAKPPRFDVAILEFAMKQAGLTIPWNHRNVLDLRTLIYLKDPKGDLAPPPTSDKHNALEDARYQAEYLRILLGEDA